MLPAGAFGARPAVWSSRLPSPPPRPPPPLSTFVPKRSASTIATIDAEPAAARCEPARSGGPSRRGRRACPRPARCRACASSRKSPTSANASRPRTLSRRLRTASRRGGGGGRCGRSGPARGRSGVGGEVAGGGDRGRSRSPVSSNWRKAASTHWIVWKSRSSRSSALPSAACSGAGSPPAAR